MDICFWLLPRTLGSLRPEAFTCGPKTRVRMNFLVSAPGRSQTLNARWQKRGRFYLVTAESEPNPFNSGQAHPQPSHMPQPDQPRCARPHRALLHTRRRCACDGICPARAIPPVPARVYAAMPGTRGSDGGRDSPDGARRPDTGRGPCCRPARSGFPGQRCVAGVDQSRLAGTEQALELRGIHRFCRQRFAGAGEVLKRRGHVRPRSPTAAAVPVRGSRSCCAR